ncbi:MAG: cobalamin-binding protein [Chloroflexota bacterium]|nr:cobalamin-binding protein [Chloroflexota bacterium]MDE3101255.1 cobalamin-binding protein [Chloroflexota bacterium]
MRVLRLLAAAILLVSCSAVPASAPPSASPAKATASAPTAAVASASPHYPLTVTDDRGKALTLTHAPRRIVSLAPSATEIVFALGMGERIVADDDFSDYPAAAKSLPHVGGVDASAGKIVSYSPDLILAIPSVRLATLDRIGEPVFVLDPNDIDGVYHDIADLGTLLDREGAANGIVADMRARIDAVAEKAKTATTRPRVLHEVDASDPSKIFVAGPHNFIDSMITTAGGVNVAADAPTKWPQLSPEEIVARDPQVIVLGDAAYGVTPALVAARPGWSGISAVRSGRVYPVDQDIVSRPGPRLVQGFEAYIRLIHPELFP